MRGRALALLAGVLSLLLLPACQRVEQELEGRLGTPAPELPDEGAPEGGGADGAARGGSDGGPVGANATLYLRGDVRELTIEVDAVEGRGPSDGAMGHLRSTLSEVTDKSDVAHRPAETFPAAQDSYSRVDLEALEAEHRETRSTPEAASLYVLVLNGSFEEGDVLGVAYSASAFAIFRDGIEEAASPLVGAPAIERAVLVHEAGHILRLVNIGYSSPRDHEDPDHPHHSRNDGSVMFWAVEAGVVAQVLGGPPPDAFDADDKADLEDIKAGRLG